MFLPKRAVKQEGETFLPFEEWHASNCPNLYERSGRRNPDWPLCGGTFVWGFYEWCIPGEGDYPSDGYAGPWATKSCPDVWLEMGKGGVG